MHHVARKCWHHSINNRHAPKLRRTCGAWLCAASRLGRAPRLQTRPQLNRYSYSLFTRQIRECSDWSELRSLFLKQRQQLNTINLLALVHQLTQVIQLCCAVARLFSVYK